MRVLLWIGEHWFDLLQTIGIIGGLLFTAHSIRRDGRARQIGNMIAIADQHRQIWKELYARPKLSRVLEQTADMQKEPVSDEEELFVTLLILHLGNVHRAMNAGMFVKLEGLQEDIRRFFSLPIPREVWEKTKPLQDHDFMRFMEESFAK